MSLFRELIENLDYYIENELEEKRERYISDGSQALIDEIKKDLNRLMDELL